MSNKMRDSLRCIDLMLSEEEADSEPSSLHNLVTLEEIENSFYQALCHKEKPSPSTQQHPICFDGGNNNNNNNNNNNSNDNTEACDEEELSAPPDALSPLTRAKCMSQSRRGAEEANKFIQKEIKISTDFDNAAKVCKFKPPPNALSDSLLTQVKCMSQFRRGMEEASKFLPKEIKLSIDFDKVYEKLPPPLLKSTDADSRLPSPGPVSMRKQRSRENNFREKERKRLLLETKTKRDEEEDLSALLDGLYLNDPQNQSILNKELVEDKMQKQRPSPRGEATIKGAGLIAELSTLVMSCAQAIASDDHVQAIALLERLSHLSTPFGYGCQRAAHYFALALQARIDGATTAQHCLCRSPPAVGLFKAVISFLWFCPFPTVAAHFMQHHILDLVQQKKPSTLHLIDLGGSSGLQWTKVIQSLSAQPDGPPKLRITGIRHPDIYRGIKNTGHRLSKYCKQFNVPFEYHQVLQEWETIKIKDLKIQQDEATVVVSLGMGFLKLLDEVEGDTSNCPRDAVLKLVRKMNPDIFIHFVYVGSYNIPSFESRVRRAFQYFMTVFDMNESCFPSHMKEERLMLERNYFGKIYNTVACEGSDRVERPESYAMWHSRHVRAGFQPLPLDGELVRALQKLVMEGYHKDYVLEGDGSWVAQGWKGQNLCAVSCWTPSPCLS